MLVKAKEIQGFEYAKKYELRVNGNPICNHFPDFTVTGKNGVVSVHETKGMESDLWRIKRKLFESLYNIEYIVIK